MKQSIGNALSQIVLDDVSPGIKRKLTPKWVKLKLFKATTNPILRTTLDLLKHGLHVFLSHFDLLKDIALLVTLISTVGGLYYVFNNLTEIQSQIIVIWACTIGLPILMNAAYFVSQPVHALGLEGSTYTRNQKIVLRIIAFLLSPLLPAILRYRKKIWQSEIDKLADTAFNLEENNSENERSIVEIDDVNKYLISNENEELNVTNRIKENKQAIQNLKIENIERKGQIEDILKQVHVIEKKKQNLRESIHTTLMNESSMETVVQTGLQISLLLMNSDWTGKNLCCTFMKQFLVIIDIKLQKRETCLKEINQTDKGAFIY